MGLLNYSTKISAEKTAGEIVGLLATTGASEIMMEYEDGKVTGIAWRINTPNGIQPFRLPADASAVERVLTKQNRSGKVPRSALSNGQPRRIAWRILKDWVQAQLAMLETEMVTVDQLFLPYMLVGQHETLYERLIGPEGFGMIEGPVPSP